jgi:hypothetical protein
MEQKVRQTAVTRREASGYTKAGPQCQKCEYFTCETEKRRNCMGSVITSEFNLRCGLGRFKVNKTGWCPSYKAKP